jgi:hypothetical protein
MRFSLPALLVLFAWSAGAQGTIPVTSPAALGATNGVKVVITHGSTLNVVFVSAGKIQVTRSVGGGPWEPPVIVSGSLPQPSHPAIAAAADGTLAVGFIANTGGGPMLYYSYKSSAANWTVPLLVPPFASDTVEDFAMVINGTQVHIATTTFNTVEYLTFPVQAPAANGRSIVPGSLCCANEHAVFPAIAVSLRPGQPDLIFVAWGLVKDATNDTCPCEDKGKYVAGIRIRELTVGYGFDDVRTNGNVQQSATINSISMTSDATGDVFLAYSDFFCVVQGLNCLSPNLEASSRTKLARFDAATKVWRTSSVPGGGDQLVGVASREVQSGANVRIASHLDPLFKPGCRLQDFEWRGTAATPTLGPTSDFADCPGAPQALFYAHACGAACEVRMLYTTALPEIATVLSCPPSLLPDLTIANLTMTGGLYPGGVAFVDFDVRNDGSAVAPQSTNSLVLTSGTQVFRANGHAVAELQPGASIHVTARVPLAATMPVGSYVVAVSADFRAQICEGDEVNNDATIGVTFQIPPACTFSGCSISSTLLISTTPGVVPSTQYFADPGVGGCAFPPTTIFNWYERIGSGPLTLIQSGPSNSVVISTGAPYHVQVDIINGIDGCAVLAASQGASDVSMNDPWLLAVLACALAVIGALLVRTSTTSS